MFRLAKLQRTMQRPLQPVLLLVLEPPLKVVEDKSNFIMFALRVRASQPAGSMTYKKYQGRLPPTVDPSGLRCTLNLDSKLNQRTL